MKMPGSSEEFNDVNLLAKAFAHKNKEYDIDENSAHIEFYNWLLRYANDYDPAYWIQNFVYEEMAMTPKEFFKYIEDNNLA